MKKSEIHCETMLQLAKLDAKIDVLLKLFAEIKETANAEKELTQQAFDRYYERSKDALIKASKKQFGVGGPIVLPYALTSGNFVDAGIPQEWRESLNSNQDAEE